MVDKTKITRLGNSEYLDSNTIIIGAAILILFFLAVIFFKNKTLQKKLKK
jgi:hypothetical protein